jgi:hypothetical protein
MLMRWHARARLNFADEGARTCVSSLLSSRCESGTLRPDHESTLPSQLCVHFISCLFHIHQIPDAQDDILH